MWITVAERHCAHVGGSFYDSHLLDTGLYSKKTKVMRWVFIVHCIMTKSVSDRWTHRLPRQSGV